MATPRFRLQRPASQHKPTRSVSPSTVISPNTLYRRAERTCTVHPSFLLRQEVVPLPSLRLLPADKSPLRISVCKSALSPLSMRFRRQERFVSPPLNCTVSQRNISRLVQKTSTSTLFKSAHTTAISKSSLRQLRRVKTAVQVDPWAEFSAWT